MEEAIKAFWNWIKPILEDFLDLHLKYTSTEKSGCNKIG